MDAFQPARNQDAWATLRGFRYQIDLTILRWLVLSGQDYLELERGEDIDLVARAVTAEGDDDFVRTLEQVKVREKRITLRSNEALQSLANAYAQFTANEEINLRFCYSTNALAARERPNPFPRGMAGIELWEQIRQETIQGDEHTQVVSSLRSFLSLATKPNGVTQASWDAFVRFMADSEDEAVIDFICRFEWSCGSEDPGNSSEEVKRQLERVAGASDSLQVDQLYQRLFLYVLQLLTKPEIKRLTRETLTQQLTAPTLSSTDHAALKRLQSRLEFVEAKLELVAYTVSSVSADVRSLVEAHGSAFAAVRPLVSVAIEAPPLVEHLCSRVDTVADLRQKLSASSWLAISGTTDTGKTHLASLVSAQKSNCGWIRFRHEMDAEQAFLVFRDALHLIANTTMNVVAAMPYTSVCRSLGKDSSLILDDVPRLQNDDALTECFTQLANTCHGADIPIISTSRFQLPSRLAALLGVQRLLEIAVPTFTDEEVRGILLAHGATKTFLTNQRVSLINTFASGHPFLLTQIAHYLQQRGWQFDEEELAALIRGDHTSGIADEVINRICKVLTEPQRDLLYRLSLSTRAVKEQVITELAEVEPAILRPRECLAALVGAWMQREDSNKFTISPIVTGVIADTLQGSTREQCHVVLGNGITRKAMDPWDADAAIRHFLFGKAYDLAGALFLELLEQFRLHEPASAYRPILSTWSQSPLPEEMHPSIKLMIRALQFWTFPRYGINDDVVLSELDTLMSQITEAEAVPAFHVASLAMLFLSKRDFQRSHRYYTQAAQVLRKAEVTRHDLIIPSKEDPVELLWTSITNIESKEHLARWKEAFDSLTPTEKKVVIASQDAALGSMVLADRLMLVESHRPEAERDWSAVLTSLQELSDWATGHKWEHLAASALKSEINVRGEFLREPESCYSKVRDFVDDPSRSEPAKSLVGGMYGKMLASNSDHEKALPWLERAINVSSTYEGHERLMTLLAAAKCCADVPERATSFTQQAVELVERNSSISIPEASKAYIEHAIAVIGKVHTSEGALKSYPAWSVTANKMLMCPDRDDAWKEVFVLFGHVHSFLVQLATTGQIPTHASDGSPYAAPYQGLCATTHPERLTLFHEESIPGIMWFQSLYARAAGDEESADVWMQRAVDEVESFPLTHITALVQQEMIPSFLQADRFADAFEAGIRGTEASVALKEVATAQEVPHAIPHSTPLEQLVNEMSADGKKLADRFALISVGIPALLRIAVVAITDRDTANGAARLLASLCRQTSQSAGESRYWTGAAEIYEALYSDKGIKDILDLAHSFDATTQQELRVMGYLAVSMSSNIEAAFCTQLASIEVLLSWYPIDSATYSKVLLSFIETYWTKAFARERFSFRSPSLVETEIQQALGQKPQERVRAILRAVRPAFRVKGLPDAEAWLKAAS